jgi:hypothetical protein
MTGPFAHHTDVLNIHVHVQAAKNPKKGPDTQVIVLIDIHA